MAPQPINVLLVEDNPGDAYIIQDLLKHNASIQVQIDHVERLESAIQQLDHTVFEVVILDLLLPDSQGLDTLLTLLNHISHIPIVVLTRLANEELAIQAVQQGAQDYLVKDQISKAILSRSIRYAIERQRIEETLKQRTLELAAANQELEQRTIQLELAKQKLEERTVQLEAANLELEAFCSSVSHDLRNPLTIINGMATALQMQYADQLDEQAQSQIKMIRQTGRRMAQLITDLLQLSQMTRSEIQLQSVDLSSMVAEIMQQQQQRQPERRLKSIIAPGVIAQGDPLLLRSALENLLDNAWKYTRTRQEAEIEWGVIIENEPSKPPSKDLTAPNPGIYFVRDNGVGFDMSQADKLFTPFQRFHKLQEFEGTGIGLATVQRIIHRHGGRIWVEAAVNQGVTVYFTLSKHHDP